MRICVFCGSSSGNRPVYHEAAARLGRTLAERRIGVVYGGGHVGLMGLLADAALAAGGEVIGVIPRALMDRLVFDPAVRSLRGQLETLAERVVRHPDAIVALADVRDSVDGMLRPPAESAPTPDLRVLVESALRHLNDLPTLTQHPLLGRTPSGHLTERPAVEGATLLRSDLIEAIERLRPGGARPDPGSSSGPGGWLHYLVLHEAYVQGRPNKQIMQRYYLSEGTFHRARRRAIDALALDLYQWVQSPASRVPEASPV